MSDLNYGAVHDSTSRTSETARHIGLLYGDGKRVRTGLNATAVATDVWTPATDAVAESSIIFQAPNASSSTTYTIPACDTLAEIAAALSDSGTALGRAVTSWFIVNSTTGVCTAKNPGVTGTFTNGTHITWTHTTTGSSGTDLPVGRLCIYQGMGTAPGMAGVAKVRLPAASTTLNPTTKQVITFVVGGTLNTGDQLRLVVRAAHLPRATATAETTYGTSPTATMAALATAAETVLNLGIDAGGLGAGYGVVATSSGADTLILTADVKGYAFDADLYVTNSASGTGSLTSKTYTGAPGAVASDIVASLYGIVGRYGASQLDSNGAPVVPPLRPAEIGSGGMAMVASTQSPALGDICWLDPATGLLYNAPSSGYIPLPVNKIHWTGVYQSDAAEVAINL
jgi:hypothetical protein